MLGTLEATGDGRLALKFSRRLRHPQAKVWRAITEPDQLRGWFAYILDFDQLQFDLRQGGKLAFVPKAEFAAVGVGHGEITALDPPRLLEYTWDAETLRWELEPDGDDGCRLRFTNVFDDAEAAATLGAGWHAGLDQLTALLAGEAVDQSGWDQLQDTYERAFAGR